MDVENRLRRLERRNKQLLTAIVAATCVVTLTAAKDIQGLISGDRVLVMDEANNARAFIGYDNDETFLGLISGDKKNTIKLSVTNKSTNIILQPNGKNKMILHASDDGATALLKGASDVNTISIVGSDEKAAVIVSNLRTGKHAAIHP